jgi:quercetin dioxygenase-like cupin family protein
MTVSVRPGIATTNTGAPLPLAALPQDDLLTINIDQIPLLKNAIGPGIHIKPLRLDPETGQVVLFATMAPGCRLPIHYHTGTAEVYTFSGCWMYAEYPDQPQTAGDYLYEPGGSVHTFYCPEDNTEDTVVLLWMSGAQLGFNDDGTFYGINDAASIQYLTDTLSAAQGTGPVPYIRGGNAGVNKS